YAALKLGADGIVPSSGNIFPEVYIQLMKAVTNGDDKGAKLWQQISDELGLLYQQGRLLPDSLSALKVIMHAMNLCDPYVLSPLRQLNTEEERSVLQKYNAYSTQLEKLLNQ